MLRRTGNLYAWQKVNKINGHKKKRQQEKAGPGEQKRKKQRDPKAQDGGIRVMEDQGKQMGTFL